MKNKLSLLSKGEIFFKIGVFFLISAPIIAGISILISSILSIFSQKLALIKSKLNIPIFISIGIISISIFKNLLFNNYDISANPNNLFDLFNWIPLFIIFLTIPPYLSKESQRIIFGKLIIMSSIPLLISCFLQNFFDIYGPFSFLNGLIIWYQREPGISTSSTTGLFNNPNYTGFVLSLILPFLIFSLINNKKYFYKFSISFFILCAVLVSIFFTKSRNAIIGALLSFILSLSYKGILIILFSCFAFLLIIFLLGNLTVIDSFLVLNNRIFNALSTLNLSNFFKTIRYEIWNKSINLIMEKPIFGWGGATFYALYQIYGGKYNIQHAHNLPMQIAQNYGIPLSLVLSIFIYYLIFNSLKISNNNDLGQNNINKYWIISLFISAFHQLFDVVLYDGRLNIMFCILITGSKCIIEETNQTKIYNN